MHRGAQVDIKDNNGMTALISASKRGNSDICKILLDYGAQVEVKDNAGKTALMYAHRRLNIVKLLSNHAISEKKSKP